MGVKEASYSTKEPSSQRTSSRFLANLANISRVTLGKLERGQMGAISVVILDIILDALGYELEFKSKEGFGLPIFGE